MTGRSIFRFAIAIGCCLVLSGCRSVWVHPEATADKHREDLARCKYGISSAEADEIVTNPDRQIPPHRPDWRNCMELLGWSTKTARRGHRIWDTP